MLKVVETNKRSSSIAIKPRHAHGKSPGHSGVTEQASPCPRTRGDPRCVLKGKDRRPRSQPPQSPSIAVRRGRPRAVEAGGQWQPPPPLPQQTPAAPEQGAQHGRRVRGTAGLLPADRAGPAWRGPSCPTDLSGPHRCHPDSTSVGAQRDPWRNAVQLSKARRQGGDRGRDVARRSADTIPLLASRAEELSEASSRTL
jgi:hypothetical protein